VYPVVLVGYILARCLVLPDHFKLRGDMDRRMADTYDQGSITHADIEAVAHEIEMLCGQNTAANVLQLRRTN
jgi:hypothetical protein